MALTPDPEKQDNVPKVISDWDGPDDADNPWNWPFWVKFYHGFLISGVSLVGTFASSVVSPAIDIISEEFHVSTELSVLAYAIYVLGLACGASFASPLSEIHGRRAIFWSSLPFFALFVLGSGFSNNITALVILRFLMGLAGSPSLSLGAPTISDLYPPETRAVPMTVFVATPFFGPALGPLIGGAVTVTLGWRWTSWMILFFSIVLFFVPAPFMRETYKKAILRKRAKRLGLEGPSSIGDGKTWGQTVITFARSGVTRPMHMFLTEPVVTAFVSYVAFNFALLYAFFAAFQTVWQDYYGFGLVIVGLTFMGIGVGVICAAAIIIVFNKFYYLPLVAQAKHQLPGSQGKTTSKVAPEKRLPIAMLGGPLMTIGLFLYGWTAAYHVHWIVPVIGEALFGCGNLLVFMASTTYVMDVYGPLFGASAQASNTLMRYVLGFAFPLFAIQMFRSLGVQWACTLLGCLCALGMCIPFCLYRWGPTLRSRTKYPIGS